MCVFFILFLSTAVLGWLGDFQRRKRVYVTNEVGPEQNNVEVEVIVDTESLITAGYLRDDCFDIDFRDTTNTKISYWLEAGCGSGTTTFWLYIPTLYVGVVEYHMYYHDTNIETNQGEAWADQFGFFRSQSCQSPMEFWDEMNGVFPMGSATQDDSTVYGSDTHFHSLSGYQFSTGNPSGSCGVYRDDECGSSLNHHQHSHTLTLPNGQTTTQGSSNPKYRNYVLCRGDPSFPSFKGLIPYQSLVMFEDDTAVTNFAPEVVVNTNDYYIRGTDFTAVLFTNDDASHTHAVDWSGVAFSANHYCARPNGGGSGLSLNYWNHVHSMGTCENTDSVEQPYLKLYFQRASQDTFFVGGMITFQYCSGGTGCGVDPPYGWERYTLADGRFLKGAIGDFLGSNTPQDHSHLFTGCLTGQAWNNYASQGSGGGHELCQITHTHGLYDKTSGSISWASALPKHKKVRFIKRKKSDKTSFTIDGQDQWQCAGTMNTETPCSGKGDCVDPEHCSCNQFYFGENCEIAICDGVYSNDTKKEICSGRGICEDGVCTCNPNYFSKNCSITSCNGTMSNDSTTCLGYGVCWPKDVCACEYGFFISTVEKVCYPCPQGKYSSWPTLNESMCEACPQGTIGLVEGLDDVDNCFVCPSGSYANENQTLCVDCPLGTYNGLQGRWNSSHCVSCPPGTFANFSGSSSCTECRRGTFSSEVGSSTPCTPCPTGFWGTSGKGGASLEEACEACPSGTFGPSGPYFTPFQCVRCPEGTYQPGSGKNKSSDCIPCGPGKGCPRGSSFFYEEDSFLEETNYLQFVEDSQGSENEGRSSDIVANRTKKYLTKVIVMGSVLFILIVAVCICCCLSYMFCVKKVLTLKRVDFFYSLAHDVEEGESVRKESSISGGAFSLFAIAIAIILITWSMIDFLGGNISSKESVRFYFGKKSDGRYDGDYQFSVAVYGNNFSRCDGTFQATGLEHILSGSRPKQFCEKRHSRTCLCSYSCVGCSIVSADALKVELDFDSEYQWITLVEYSLVLPHYEESKDFFVNGKMYSENGTLAGANLDISLFATEHQKLSIWNLVTQTVNYEEFSHSYGMGATMKSFGEDIKDELDWETGNQFKFLFNMELSSFLLVVTEELGQSMMNFVAQLFALITLSISLSGILFAYHGKFLDLLRVCLRCTFCWPGMIRKNKTEKVTPESSPGEECDAEEKGKKVEMEKKTKELMRLLEQPEMKQFVRNIVFLNEENGEGEEMQTDENSSEDYCTKPRSEGEKESFMEENQDGMDCPDEENNDSEELTSSSAPSSSEEDVESKKENFVKIENSLIEENGVEEVLRIDNHDDNE